MSYAVRNDGAGFRAVDGPDDLEENEWYSEDIPPEPVPLPPTPEELATEARAERDSQLAMAAIRIAPLQDAMDLDEATPAEQAALTAWKKFRVALNRIEQQAGFPGQIDWPAQPA